MLQKADVAPKEESWMPEGRTLKDSQMSVEHDDKRAHLIVPFPGLHIDGLTHGSQNAQRLPGSLPDNIIALCHERSDGCRGCVEEGHLQIVSEPRFEPFQQCQAKNNLLHQDYQPTANKKLAYQAAQGV